MKPVFPTFLAFDILQKAVEKLLGENGGKTKRREKHSPNAEWQFIKHCRLDHSGIMFVVDLNRDTLTCPIQWPNNYNARDESDHNTKIFGSWKKIFTCQPTLLLINWPAIIETDESWAISTC